MANLLEVLVTCDSNNTLWSCCVWDPHTGASLMTYKGGGTAHPKTLSFIGNDYIAAVEKTKPMLHIWALNSQQTLQGVRFVLPGKAAAFAVTHDATFCVAGIDEKIYLWQIASGNLLTIINRHYQKIVILRFTPDGRYFVSAAEDGMVMVWSLTTVAAHPEVELVTQSSAGQHDPLHIFSDHSLPVTDLCISQTGMQGRLCTTSTDRTCKIYDLVSGEMLLNVVFDVALSAVAFDVLELNVFVGSTEGNIYQFSLTNPPRSRDVLVNSDHNLLSFTSHTKAITCLSVSLDGETLVSGAQDDQVILWHIKSRQPTRIIRHKGPITNAFFTLNQPSIYKQDFSPSIVLHSLERSLERDTDEITEIELFTKQKIDFWSENGNAENDSAIEKLSDEFKHEYKQKEDVLLEEIEKLKKINANLYKYSVDKVLTSMPIKEKNNESNVNNPSKKKKKKKAKSK